MGGRVRLSVRKTLKLRLALFLWGEERNSYWEDNRFNVQPEEEEKKTERVYTCGLTWAQLSGCCGRQLCSGLSGCESGFLTVASPLLMSPNSPPVEPPRCRRAGCGSGLQHRHTDVHSLVMWARWTFFQNQMGIFVEAFAIWDCVISL